MPLKFKMKSNTYDGYLLEYRKDHSCPLLVGLGVCIISVGINQIVNEVDSENLSRLSADNKERNLTLKLV